MKSVFQERRDSDEHQRPVEEDSLMYIYRGAFRMMGLLSLLGCGLLLLNVLVPDFSSGCMDPLISTTFASSLFVGQIYQWVFVLLSAAIMLTFGYGLERLRRHSPASRGIRVYTILLYMCRPTEFKAAQNAIVEWRTAMVKCSANGHHKDGFVKLFAMHIKLGFWRQVFYWVFHLPLLVLASVPAFGYVSHHRHLRSLHYLYSIPL